MERGSNRRTCILLVAGCRPTPCHKPSRWYPTLTLVGLFDNLPKEGYQGGGNVWRGCVQPCHLPYIHFSKVGFYITISFHDYII